MFEEGALTAKRYIEMNWGALPEEIDPEEQHIINLLRELEIT